MRSWVDHNGDIPIQDRSSQGCSKLSLLDQHNLSAPHVTRLSRDASFGTFVTGGGLTTLTTGEIRWVGSRINLYIPI